jgi:two-component system, NarL family, response regulator LiaR
MKTISVVIADDHPAFREGLCRILAEEKELEIIGQASDGDEIVSLTKDLQPDVAIVDISMPKQNGIEATKGIKQSSPNTAVLIMSAYNYQSYVLASLSAGANGYITKDTPICELVAAVRLANAGDQIIDHYAANLIIRNIATHKGNNENLELHPRQIEIIKLIARGLRNKEIAHELKISERTVQAHLCNIFNKLNVDSRTEAVLQALKQGWLDIHDITSEN